MSDRSYRRQSPDDGLPTEAKSAEFNLRGVRYRVFPDPDSSAWLRPPYDTAPSVAGTALGAFESDGVRYLISAEAPAAAADDPRSEPGTDQLTPRELQIASMVCEGCTNKQIADRLHLSCWTVSSYLRRIFGKLQVRTRAAMVARVLAGLRD